MYWISISDALMRLYPANTSQALGDTEDACWTHDGSHVSIHLCTVCTGNGGDFDVRPEEHRWDQCPPVMVMDDEAEDDGDNDAKARGGGRNQEQNKINKY